MSVHISLFCICFYVQCVDKSPFSLVIYVCITVLHVDGVGHLRIERNVYAYVELLKNKCYDTASFILLILVCVEMLIIL